MIDLLAYYSKGYSIIKKFFQENEISEMITAAENLEKTAQSLTDKIDENDHVKHNGSEFVYHYSKPKLVCWAGANEPILFKYGRDERILELVKTIFCHNQAENLVNQLHFKLPGVGEIYPVHQDIGHRLHRGWDESVNNGINYVQFIIALDEANEDNGCLRFIDDTNVTKLAYDKNKELNPDLLKKSKPVPMKPGDLIFFDPYIPHCSDGNLSNKPRRVLASGFAYPGAYTREKKYPGEGSGELIDL